MDFCLSADEEAAAAGAQEEAAAAQSSAQQQAATLEQQLGDAQHAARSITAEAARLRAKADAEQHVVRLHEGGSWRAVQVLVSPADGQPCVCVFIPVPVRHRLPTTLHARPTTNAHALFWTAELQQAQLAAEGRVSQAEAAAAELRERQGELAARRAGLQHELGSAERRAASAR